MCMESRLADAVVVVNVELTSIIDVFPASMSNIPEYIAKDFTNGKDAGDPIYEVKKKKNRKTKKFNLLLMLHY